MADAAAARDEALRPVLLPMVGQSSRTIAKALTDQGVEPPRGGVWSNKTVLRMMARLGARDGWCAVITECDNGAIAATDNAVRELQPL